LRTFVITQAAIATAAFGQTAPSTTQSATDSTPETTIVHRGTLKLAFEAEGVFAPLDPFEVRLSLHQYQGELRVQKAAVADRTVAKGDVLLALDTAAIDRQITAAESALDVAKANLAKAESDVTLGDRADKIAMDASKQSLADAQESLARWDKTDGPAAVLAGKMPVMQADEVVDNATDELAQLKLMYKSEDLTNQTTDIVLKRATRTLEQAKSADQLAKQLSDKAITFDVAVHRRGLASAVESATLAVDQQQATQAQAQVTRAGALATAKAAAADAQRTLDDLKRDRTAMTITAPFDGVVVYGTFDHRAWQVGDTKHFLPDQKVPADQTLMSVYHPGKMKALLICPESKIALVPAGTKVTVTSPALPGIEYTGAAEAVGTFVTMDKDLPTIDVPIALLPVDEHLVPGYAINVAVEVPALKYALLIPTTAVAHGHVTLQHADGKQESKAVVIGHTDGKEVEIVSGLKENDVVLTTDDGDQSK
jgi:cobalt-zinc-cadmium efflux system membrane fusion protein